MAGRKKTPGTHKPRKSAKGTTRKSTRVPPDWRETFLAGLATTGRIYLAAQIAGVDPKTAYNHRRGDPEFAQAWELALTEAVVVAESTLYERAITGVSDACLIFLLKCRKRAVYGDKARLELTGADGGPIRVKAEDLTDDALAAIAAAGGDGA